MKIELSIQKKKNIYVYLIVLKEHKNDVIPNYILKYYSFFLGVKYVRCDPVLGYIVKSL